MRNSRLIRNRCRRKKKESVDIDITSLLDILVILLVFLLKSYNSSGIVLNVPKGVTLPKSESRSFNTSGVIIQVSPTTIWVDDKLVYDINKSPGQKIYDQNRKRIIPLFNELVRKKNTYKTVKKTSPHAKKFSGVINLIVDRTIKYSYIKKLLHTSAEAGYKKYKFVVLGEEQ